MLQTRQPQQCGGSGLVRWTLMTISIWLPFYARLLSPGTKRFVIKYAKQTGVDPGPKLLFHEFNLGWPDSFAENAGNTYIDI